METTLGPTYVGMQIPKSSVPIEKSCLKDSC